MMNGVGGRQGGGGAMEHDCIIVGNDRWCYEPRATYNRTA